MATDLPGVNRVRSAPIPPSAPARPVDPSRALVPVRPVTPRGTDTTGPDIPLGRSGVSALDLLATADLLVERDAVAPVALDMGLETARGALLRQQPGEALEALDAVWARASESEEGWYLRSGALAVLGLSAEADQVAMDGLERAPRSLALRFVLSLARTALGDIAGARAALAPALEAAPNEPILLAQQATLLARHERGRDGDSLLARLRAVMPDHPAVRWAQEEIRKLRADAFAAKTVEARVTDFADVAPAAAEARGLQPNAASVEAVESTPVPEQADVCETAFARLGVTLGVAGSADAVAEARTLLRALSVGGALASGCLPEQAHGARTLLASIVGALRGDVGADVPPVVRQLVTAIRSGRLADTERTLQRELRTLPYPQRPWVEALLRELRPSSRTPARPVTPMSEPVVEPEDGGNARALSGEVFGEGATIVGDRRDDGAAVPVRLGLALLSESAASRQAARARGDFTEIDPLTGERFIPVDDGRVAAALMGVSYSSVPRADTLDLGMVLPPFLALAVATAAGLNGATMVSVLAVGAAAWLALRRRTVSVEPYDGSRPPGGRDQGTGID